MVHFAPTFPPRIGAIISISVLIVMGLIIVNYASFRDIRDLNEKQLVEAQLLETKFAASQIETHIKQVKEELTALSTYPSTTMHTLGGCSNEFPELPGARSNGKIDSLLRADRNGKIIACFPSPFEGYLGLNIENQEYFTEPKITREPYIAGLIKQGTNRQIIISVPLFQTTSYTPYPNFKSGFEGVLLSIIDVNRLYYLYLLPAVRPEQGSFILYSVDRKEIIVQSETLANRTLSRNVLAQKKAAYITTLPDTGEAIITSADIVFGTEHWRLYLFVSLDQVSDAVGKVHRQYLLSSIFVLLVSSGTLLATIFLYRSKEHIREKLHQATATLEHFGITAEKEPQRYTPADLQLEAHTMYLLNDPKENQAYELFLSALNQNYLGLGLVRDDPRRVREKYNVQKTPLIWLTSNTVKGVPCERTVLSLRSLLLEFLEKNPRSVILIQSIDYLILENGFESVIKLLHALQDSIAVHPSIVLLSVNAELMEKSHLAALEAFTMDIYGRSLRDGISLPPMEKEIIRFINDSNIRNTLVSYKDITAHFDITKPTTRVKIFHLQQLGLVAVEPRGRFKSLRATSKGRALL